MRGEFSRRSSQISADGEGEVLKFGSSKVLKLGGGDGEVLKLGSSKVLKLGGGDGEVLKLGSSKVLKLGGGSAKVGPFNRLRVSAALRGGEF